MKTRMISLRLPDSDVADLDQWAARLGMTRTGLLKELLAANLKSEAKSTDRWRLDRRGLHNWPEEI